MAGSAFQGITFQALILKLNAYWAGQGCVLIQPLDLEVGAGTFHPATFLRALGPEPWNAAYVQPCRRPTDGRPSSLPATSTTTASSRGSPAATRIQCGKPPWRRIEATGCPVSTIRNVDRTRVSP